MTDSNVVDFDLDPIGNDALTLARSVAGEGKYIRRGPGPVGYAHFRVSLSPYRGPRLYRFNWEVPDGELPLSFMRTASLEGVKAALRDTRRGGVPLAFISVSVLGGSYHETDTTEVAVSIAASMAVKDALGRSELVKA